MISKIKKIIKNKLYREMEEGDIVIDELKSYQNNGAVVVDVRSPQEYEEGHIDGAISIPEYNIKKNVENILKDKNEKIIVYCSSGGRSRKAQKTLKKLGYNKVYNLYNGIENYF